MFFWGVKLLLTNLVEDLKQTHLDTSRRLLLLNVTALGELRLATSRA